MLIIIIICYLTRAPGQVPESLVRLRVCTILTSALLGVLITSLYGSSLNACLAPLLSPATPLHHVLTRHASLAGAKTGSAAQGKLQSDEATSDGLQQSSVATFRPLSKSSCNNASCTGTGGRERAGEVVSSNPGSGRILVSLLRGDSLRVVDSVQSVL